MAEASSTVPSTPGQLLRSARQLYGWSVEEVAAELNLLPYIIKALENDDYDQLAGWTYVVGYLRSYGKLASVNVESAIEQHEALLPPVQDGPGTITESVDSRQPIAIHYRWVVTAIVLIVVAGGLFGAYLKRSGDVEKIDLADDRVVDDALLVKREPAPVSSDQVLKMDSEPTDQVNLVVATSNRTQVAADGGGQAKTLAQTTDLSLVVAVTTSTIADGSETISSEDDAAGRSVQASVESTSNQPSAGAVSMVQTTVQLPTARAETSTQEAGPKRKQVIKTKISADASSVSVRVGGNLIQTGFLDRIKAPKAQRQTGQVSANRQDTPVEDVKVYRSTGKATDTDGGRVTALLQSKSKMTIVLKRGGQVIVRDGNGRQLLRKYFPSGKVVTVSGIPPFDVRLQRVEGVRVLYNGKPVKIPVPESGWKARFQVGVTRTGISGVGVSGWGRGE